MNNDEQRWATLIIDDIDYQGDALRCVSAEDPMNRPLRGIATWLMIPLFFLSVASVTAGAAARAKNKKPKPEDVIKKHLESVGDVAAIYERKSLKAEGTATMEVVIGGSGRLQGPTTLLSDGDKLRMSMVFGINEYPGEDVAYDGQTVETGYVQPGVRSKLGQFLYDFDQILSEGLFGGVLSTSWSLLDLENRRPKLKYEGLKKLDGQKYHTVRYRRREGGDVQTRLYFDTEAFRHCHTVYTVRISSRLMGGRGGDGASASQPETLYTLKESFTNFQAIVKLTLPTRWVIEFTTEIGRQGSMLRFTTQYVTMATGRSNAIPAGEFDLN